MNTVPPSGNPNAAAPDTAKEVAFYAALVEAWINTRMERDKQVLTLSSLALSGLIAFTAGLKDGTEFALWLSAATVFIVSILCALLVFAINAEFIQKLIREESADALDVVLKILDRAVMLSFFLGVCITFSLAIVKADFSLTKNINAGKEVQNVRPEK